MATPRKLIRQAARSQLGSHPTAIEVVKVASSMSSMAVDVVVFEENRVFVAASSSARLMLPRPMTPAEAAAAECNGSQVERSDEPEGSLLIPVRVRGELVAGLSLHSGDTMPEETGGLEALGRMLGGLLDDDTTSGRADFREKVLAGLRDCVLVMSPEMDLVWVSKGVNTLLGHNPAEMVGRSAVDFIHPDDLESTFNAAAKILEGLEVYRFTVRVLNAGGDYTPVEITGNDLSGEPAVGGIVLSLRDALPDSDLGIEVEQARQLSAAIVEGLPDGLIATDRYGMVTVANSVARSMFAVDPSAGAAHLDLATFALFTINGRPLDLLEPTESPVRCLLTDNGDVRYLDCAVQEVVAVDGPTLGRVIVLTDVTGEHRAAEDLREQAMHDQLTGLPNRRQMEARLSTFASRPTPGVVAACFIDLDAFKLVNDNHGHKVGDHVIRIAAQRLHAELRDNDLLVRHGGDEFVALLLGVESLAAAETIAQRFLTVLSQPYEVGDERFDLTASIGVAIATADGLVPDTLLQHADIALYEAKGTGRNRVQVFDDSLALSVSNEEQQRRLLRDALDEDRVVMHFQPLVDSSTDRTLGFEALARVRTRDGAILTPEHFLEAVSHTGMMWDLDRVAFALACDAAQMLTSIDPHRAPYVACNFSSVSLTHPDFVDFVVDTTAAAGVSTSQICIEVTESAAFNGGGRSAEALHKLKRAGYQLALDDFGTGYSSLAHLRDLPITSVKVDKSFVARLGTHTSERAIAEAVVTLARDLDLGVVAEGVETVEQLRQVKAMGFETIQGWHYSRALPIDRCLEHWRQSTGPASAL